MELQHVLQYIEGQTHPPVKFRDYALMTSIMNVIEPLKFEQAKDKKEWVTAMNE